MAQETDKSSEHKRRAWRIEIGAMLREARVARKMTQTALASATGLHQPDIAEIEAGRRNITIETLGAMLTAMGIGAIKFTNSANNKTTKDMKAIDKRIIEKAQSIAEQSNGYYQFIPTAEYAQSIIDSTVSEYEEFNEEMPEIWVKRIELLRDLLADFAPAIIDMESPCIESTLTEDGFWFDGQHYTAD